MQTSSLVSSHPASLRNATDNSVSEKPAQTAEPFGEVMHRALGGATAKPNQQNNLSSPFAEETARENKSDSDKVSTDKKRARSKKNPEPASTSIASQLPGIAGAPPATPPPTTSPAGNTHDSDEAKGSPAPISDNFAKPETTEKTETVEAKTADQAVEPASNVKATAPPTITPTVTPELAAQSIEANSEVANPAEAAVPTESNPPTASLTDSKPSVAQAAATPPHAGGTSAAKQDMTMKKAEKTPKVAGSAEQDLPGITAIGSEEMPKGQKLSAKEAIHDSEKLETAVVEMPLRVLTPSESPAPTVTAAAPATSPTLDPRILERTHDIVALHAMRVGEYTADSLHVVVKPGAGIQLSLELRQSARGIEVRASLHKGDFEQLNQHWPDLQQRLEARGVRLASLTTSENFSSTSHQQFQQSKQQFPNQDPLYAGAFAEFALAGSMNEAPAARAARATAYRGWETWA